MNGRRQAKTVSPAKAERLKRKAEQERCSQRNFKLLLIAIAVATAAFFLAFCVWYEFWIKQPHDADQPETLPASHHDH